LATIFSGCGDSPQVRDATKSENTGISQNMQSSEIPRAMKLLQEYREEKRFALVIGNNNYQNLTTLRNAVNDSRSIQKSLEKLNFEVFLQQIFLRLMNTLYSLLLILCS
jgi:hypothetical protein